MPDFLSQVMFAIRVTALVGDTVFLLSFHSDVRVAEGRGSHLRDISKQSDFGCGDKDSPSMRRSSDWPGRDGTWRPLSDRAACWVAVEGVVGGTSLEEGVAGRVDQARSRRRHGGDGSRKLVGVEGSDPRLHEEVGAQCRGGGRGQEGYGGACERFPHGQEKTSLPRWITAELWTMLLHASRNLSPGGKGIGYQRKRKLSWCLLCLWWGGTCVEFGLLEQRRWRGTTARVLLCMRATRRAPRERQWCTCYLLWASSSSKFC